LVLVPAVDHFEPFVSETFERVTSILERIASQETVQVPEGYERIRAFV